MILWVGVGGIFGAIVRFLLGNWFIGRPSVTFPFGTWIINISGSFILGILAALHFRNVIPEWSWFLLGTGFLGAYTTFSTFGVETINMLQKKDTRNAVIYVLSTVILGISFAWVGGLFVTVLI
ncbi:MAG: fluoride efflux transporter CrcB [Bacillota bacterium]